MTGTVVGSSGVASLGGQVQYLARAVRHGKRRVDRIAIAANLATVAAFPVGMLARRIGHPFPYLMRIPYRFVTPFGELAAPGGTFFIEGADDFEVEVGREVDALTGGTFIDVGSAIGYYALRASRRLGAGGRVIAVEPHPRRFRYLCRNVRANLAGNVHCVNAAAADADTPTLWLRDLTLGPNHQDVSSTGSGPRLRVRGCRVDSLVDEDENVALVKIDVEGAEPSVLRGMSRVIDRCRPTIVFECLDSAGLRECEDLLVAHGYAVAGSAPGNLIARPA